MSERRCKVIFLSDELVIDAILRMRNSCNVAYRIDGLPDGWVVERINYFSDRSAIGVLIHHPSFHEVPNEHVWPELTEVTCAPLTRGSSKASFREFF